MSKPTFAVLVRFQSGLDHDEIQRIMAERAPGFRALDGLNQKYYLHQPGTETYGGFYLWQTREDYVQYQGAELAETIGTAYQVAGVPDVEVFEILMAIRDDA